MGKEKQDAAGNEEGKKGAKLSLGQRLKRFWSITVNRLLVQFIVLIGLFYVLWSAPFFQHGFIGPLSEFYASISGVILSLIGYPVQVIGDSINNGKGIAVNIRNGCDGIEGLAIFWVGILIFPTKWKDKLLALLFGSLFLVALNVIRIVTLYWFRINVPSLFEMMHVSVWQVLFIALTVATLLFWIGWTNKRNELQWNS